MAARAAAAPNPVLYLPAAKSLFEVILALHLLTLTRTNLFHKAAPDAPYLHWSWDALREGRRHSDTWVGCIVWSVTASTTARTPTTTRGARP